VGNPVINGLQRAILPVSVFTLAYAGHFFWYVLSNPAPALRRVLDTGYNIDGQAPACGTSCASGASAETDYIGTQTYLLGYAFALSLAFAVVSVRQYLEDRSRAACGAAVGGAGLSALLGGSGCFAGCLFGGCCGSPMPALYVSLLGTTFLPFGKPLVAAITTVCVFACAWWLRRSRKNKSSGDKEISCCAGCSSDCKPAAARADDEV
jgi:hypothetical protein